MILIRLSGSQNRHAWTCSLFYPKRAVLVSIALSFLTSVVLAQIKPPSPAPDLRNPPNTAADEASDIAIRSIEALKRLEKLVPVHTSRGSFEANTRLSSVPFDVFRKEFERVLEEIEPLLCRLPQDKLKTQIVNALSSYRDGVFWWGRANEPRVITISALSFRHMTSTPAKAAYSTTIPYIVAVHWRHASKYLKRARVLIADSRVR